METSINGKKRINSHYIKWVYSNNNLHLIRLFYENLNTTKFFNSIEKCTRIWDRRKSKIGLSKYDGGSSTDTSPLLFLLPSYYPARMRGLHLLFVQTSVRSLRIIFCPGPWQHFPLANG